jgi:DNA-3-methyladenine glycosylase II
MARARRHAEAERALAASCPRIGALIAKVGSCGLSPEGELTAERHFEGLVRAIVSQQLSSKAAATIFDRVQALASTRSPGPTAANVVDLPGAARPGLPAPAAFLAIPELELRAAGLSGAKTASVRDLAAKIAAGALRLDAVSSLPDEAVIEALCQVRGIGRWTAEMFLMFRLGRDDVLPIGDLGIQKGMMTLFALRRLPSPERMRALARPWQPYRSIACWYLWRLGDMKAPAGAAPDPVRRSASKAPAARKKPR